MLSICSVLNFFFGCFFQFFVNVRFKNVCINDFFTFAFESIPDFFFSAAMFNFSIAVFVSIMIKICSFARNVITSVINEFEISFQSSSPSSKIEKNQKRVVVVVGDVQTRKFTDFVVVVAWFIGFGCYINFIIAYRIAAACLRSYVRQLRSDRRRPRMRHRPFRKYQRKNGIAQPSSSSSSSMVRRVRKSVERNISWSGVVRRRFFDGPTMVLAIFVINMVLGVGECTSMGSRQHRRQTGSFDPDVKSLEFVDADGTRRDAPTMGGSVKMSLNFQCHAPFALYDGRNKLLGEGICGHRSHFIEFNITDDMTLTGFVLTNAGETSNPFHPLRFVLEKRPMDTPPCGSGEVYAKVANGTKCVQLASDSCVGFESSKLGCPGKRTTFCATLPLAETDKPLAETDKGNECPQDVPTTSRVGDPTKIPNDGLIKLTKDQTIRIQYSFDSRVQYEYKIDRFDGNRPTSGTNSSAENLGYFIIDVPSDFFDKPFKARLEITMTVTEVRTNKQQKFYMRHDVVYMETDMGANVKALCKTDGTCAIEASGNLVDFLEPHKDFFGGLMINGIRHEVHTFRLDNVNEKAKVAIWWAVHRWDGQVTEQSTRPIEMDITHVPDPITTTVRGDQNTTKDLRTEPPSTDESSTKGNPTSATTTETDEAKKKREEEEKLRNIVIGVVVAVIIVALIIAAIIFGVWYRRRSKPKPEPEKKRQGDVETPPEKDNEKFNLGPDENKVLPGAVNTVGKIDEKQRPAYDNNAPGVVKIEKMEAKAELTKRPMSRFNDFLLYVWNQASLLLHASTMPDMFGYKLTMSQAPLLCEAYRFLQRIFDHEYVVVMLAPLNAVGKEDKNKFVSRFFPEKVADEALAYSNPENKKDPRIVSQLVSFTTLREKEVKEKTEDEKEQAAMEKKGGKKKKEETMDPEKATLGLVEYTVKLSKGKESKVKYFLHLDGFKDTVYKFNDKDMKTLCMTVMRMRDRQREAKIDERDTWVHCLAGLERSAVVSALFQMWQMILHTGSVNVEEIMYKVRRNRIGAFSSNPPSDHSKTSIEALNDMWNLLHDAAKILLKWQQERIFTYEQVPIDQVPVKEVEEARHPDARATHFPGYQYLGSKSDNEEPKSGKSKVESKRGATSSAKSTIKPTASPSSKSPAAKSVVKTTKSAASKVGKKKTK